MAGVRLLTLIIALSWSSQALTMFRLLRSTGPKTGRANAQRFYAQAAVHKPPTLGEKILIAGTVATAAACVATLFDMHEKQDALEEFTTFFLNEKNDLPALIEHAHNLGINPNDLVTTNGTTPLMHACKTSDLCSLKKLIVYGNLNINRQDYRGKTALMYACSRENLDIVALLCTCDEIDFNIQDIYGLTVLINVIRKSNNPALVQLILEQPTIAVNKMCKEVYTVRIQDRADYHPPHVTAIYHDGTSRKLSRWPRSYQHGQKITSYVSALSEAIYFSRPDILQILLDLPGIDIDTEWFNHAYSYDGRTQNIIDHYNKTFKVQAQTEHEQKILKKLEQLTLKE